MHRPPAYTPDSQDLHSGTRAAESRSESGGERDGERPGRGRAAGEEVGTGRPAVGSPFPRRSDGAHLRDGRFQ